VTEVAEGKARREGPLRGVAPAGGDIRAEDNRRGSSHKPPRDMVEQDDDRLEVHLQPDIQVVERTRTEREAGAGSSLAVEEGEDNYTRTGIHIHKAQQAVQPPRRATIVSILLKNTGCHHRR
jgi:hypothetical protein